MLSELPEMSAFAQRHRLRQFSPVEKLLETLVETYREWGGSEVPGIAIVDWKDLPTSSEFVLLRDSFEDHGVRTIICSPEDLEYANGKLRCGDFVIDLIYKRIIIHELLARHDDTHPLVRAFLNGDVCLINPFRCKIMHKKASFELLTDETRPSWFTPRNARRFRNLCRGPDACVTAKPHSALRRSTSLNLSGRGGTLVIKPNDDYGGRGIIWAHG